jgi:hypothetical protein
MEPRTLEWPYRRLEFSNQVLASYLGARNGDTGMHDLEQAIRERAYHLWVAEGRRDGDADAHWLSAQREVLRASLSTFARVKSGQPKVSKSKALSNSKKKNRAA